MIDEHWIVQKTKVATATAVIVMPLFSDVVRAAVLSYFVVRQVNEARSAPLPIFTSDRDRKAEALMRVLKLGPLSPDDDPATLKSKLDALKELRRAAIDGGMLLLSSDEINAEVARRRGVPEEDR